MKALPKSITRQLRTPLFLRPITALSAVLQHRRDREDARLRAHEYRLVGLYNLQVCWDGEYDRFDDFYCYCFENDLGRRRIEVMGSEADVKAVLSQHLIYLKYIKPWQHGMPRNRTLDRIRHSAVDTVPC